MRTLDTVDFRHLVSKVDHSKIAGTYMCAKYLSVSEIGCVKMKF